MCCRLQETDHCTMSCRLRGRRGAARCPVGRELPRNVRWGADFGSHQSPKSSDNRPSRAQRTKRRFGIRAGCESSGSDDAGPTGTSLAVICPIGSVFRSHSAGSIPENSPWGTAPSSQSTGTWAISMRSSLFSLASHGIGTTQAESLTSFIRRLAAAHVVSPSTLLRELVLKPQRSARGRGNLIFEPSSNQAG